MMITRSIISKTRDNFLNSITCCNNFPILKAEKRCNSSKKGHESLEKATSKKVVFELKEPNSTRIDRSTLFDPSIHLPDIPDFKDPKFNYEEKTSLSEELQRWIGISGPISISSYMTTVLNDPRYGYYSSNKRTNIDLFQDDDEEEVIGKAGDFTTAPEISQVFGESILVFFLSLWQKNSMKKEIEFIELGPGKGTLMYDVLYTAISNFPAEFASYIRNVHLVEVNPDLKQKQRKKLNELNNQFNDFEIIFNQNQKTSEKKKYSINITWHEHFNEIPKAISNKATQYIIGQELLDALPMNAFQKTNDGWREILIDVDTADNPNYVNLTKEDQKRPRLRFVLSKEKTNRVSEQLMPFLKDYLGDNKNLDTIPLNSIIELSPPSTVGLIHSIQTRIEENSNGAASAALLIDYGYMEKPKVILTQSTLRAFSKHKIQHPLSLPGKVDLTYDVNFFQLQQQLFADCKVVTQQEFLSRMGIVERVVALIDEETTTEEQAEELTNALERLISGEKDMMGLTYKVMVMVHSSRKEIPGF